VRGILRSNVCNFDLLSATDRVEALLLLSS
jgi:hypothetical protein